MLDNIFIRFGTKLYRQVVWIPIGTNCAHLVADLFLICYERDFMMSLSDDNQADVIDAFFTNIQVFGRYFRVLICKPNIYVSGSTSELRVRLVHS